MNNLQRSIWIRFNYSLSIGESKYICSHVHVMNKCLHLVPSMSIFNEFHLVVSILTTYSSLNELTAKGPEDSVARLSPGSLERWSGDQGKEVIKVKC